MRSLGVALYIAWISVGLDLQWLPPNRLQSEISFAKDFIESMKDSPLNDLPEMQQAVEQSTRLPRNQSRREITLWVAWSAFLLMVGYGLWTAYAIFRQRSYALGCVLVGCSLFLGRQAIFHRAAYELLLDGTDIFERILRSGNYQFAFSIIWHHYVVGIFFFFVAIFSSIQLFQRWIKKAQRV